VTPIFVFSVCAARKVLFYVISETLSSVRITMAAAFVGPLSSVLRRRQKRLV
jgi:hypothetical protein